VKPRSLPQPGDTITHQRHTHRRLTVLEVLPAGQLVVRNSRTSPTGGARTYTITRPEEWLVLPPSPNPGGGRRSPQGEELEGGSERTHTGLQTEPLPASSPPSPNPGGGRRSPDGDEVPVIGEGSRGGIATPLPTSPPTSTQAPTSTPTSTPTRKPQPQPPAQPQTLPETGHVLEVGAEAPLPELVSAPSAPPGCHAF
jgi:hypothetical protein